VRKALNSLTDAKILTRKQGIGTFVSEHTGHHSLYRFFPLIADGKSPELPKAELLLVETQMATMQVAEALELDPNAKVIVLNRRRILNNEFCMAETIYLPHKYFAILENNPEVPHTLYHFYQTQFNLTVRDTRDSIKAVLATEKDADMLGIKEGDPLLEVTRVTHSLDNKAIEFRLSRCRSDNYHYLVELG
jgi:GntR family transcriptional regulator